MIESYINNVLRFRWLVMFFVLAVVAVIGSGVTKLKISANLEIFFPQGNEEMETYDAFRNEFVRDDSIMFTVAPADGEIFTPKTLSVVEQITDSSWRMPYAQRVDSITNYQHTEADGDDLLVAPLVDDALNMSAEQIAKAKQVALAEPLLLGRLISDRSHVTGVFVTIHMPNEKRAEAIRQIITSARAIRDELEAAYPDIRIRIGGKVAGNNAFTEATQQDLRTLIPLALLVALLCIVGYLFYASGSVVSALSGVFIVIVVIVTSVAVGMGMAGRLGYPITPPMANAPTMILTLAVADSMHLLVTFFQRLRKGEDRFTAMAYSLRLNFQAVFLTSLTTVIGFLALNTADAPPFGELGNTVAIGIVAAWIVTITLLPALGVILPIRVKRSHSDEVRMMESLADWVIDHRKSVAIVLATVSLACVALIPKNQLYDVWAEYFDESVEAREAIDFARANLTGMNTIEFSLSAGGDGDIADPDYLQRLDAFGEHMRKHPDVVHVNSIAEIMKRLNKNMNGDDPAYYRLPEDRELAAQYLLLYELSLPFGLDLTNQINLSKSATRLTVAMGLSSTLTVDSVQTWAHEWLRENAPPEMFHPGTSSDVMFAFVGRSTIISMLTGAGIGLFTISLILLFALRSVRLGIISFVANCLPIAIGFGFWALLSGRVGMGLSVVLGITMGIVVDYTVHLLSKYRIAQRDHDFDAPQAIRYAFGTVGVALFVTTIILVANFGLLLFSNFVLNSDMGTLTAMIILIALVVDLFLLPPILIFSDRRKAPA